MSDFATYASLGFRHIVDIQAMDHVLFLLALAAIYRWRDARSALAVITAFTVGHSLTLALAVTKVVQLPPALIEFLIPVTIVVTGIENLATTAERRAARRGWYRPLIAGVFGLIHGAGFANYLNALFVEEIVVPLFGFNLGIELAQIVVLIGAAGVLTTLDATMTRLRLEWRGWPAYRIRVTTVSVAVVVIASQWAVERAPW
jgi:hypothetical protein